jgi:hypothetical protein
MASAGRCTKSPLRELLVVAVPVSIMVAFAIRGDLVEGHVWRNVIAGHHVAHALLHALDLFVIVIAAVVEPARVIAIEMVLVFRGQHMPHIRPVIVIAVATMVVVLLCAHKNRRQQCEKNSTYSQYLLHEFLQSPGR